MTTRAPIPTILALAPAPYPSRRGIAALACAVLAASLGGGRASADETLDRLEPVLAQIDGIWIGKKMKLEIAGKELRARLDAGNWEALQVHNITGNMIIFTLGPDALVAMMRDKTLEVTVRGVDGSQTLVRPGASAPANVPKPR